MKQTITIENGGYGGFSPKDILQDFIRNTEFKRLLNQIVFAQTRKGARSIALLSQYPKEGKTLLAAGVAMGYSLFLRKRVLLIDTVSSTRNESFFIGRVIENDIVSNGSRGSSVSNQFSGQDFSQGEIDLMSRASIAKQIQYNQAHLYQDLVGDEALMAAATGTATMDFHLRYLLQSLRSNYDLILIDCCSISAALKGTIDPMILAQQSDGAILITSFQTLERNSLIALKKQLKSSQVELIGTVFNPGASDYLVENSIHGTKQMKNNKATGGIHGR